MLWTLAKREKKEIDRENDGVRDRVPERDTHTLSGRKKRETARKRMRQTERHREKESEKKER